MAATEQHCASCYVFALSSPAICARTHTHTHTHTLLLYHSQDLPLTSIVFIQSYRDFKFLIPNLTFTVTFQHFQQHTYCLLSRLLKETHTHTLAV